MFIASSHVPISVLLVCIIILGVFKSGCGCSRRLENYSPAVQYYVQNLIWSFNLEFFEINAKNFLSNFLLIDL